MTNPLCVLLIAHNISIFGTLPASARKRGWLSKYSTSTKPTTTTESAKPATTATAAATTYKRAGRFPHATSC